MKASGEADVVPKIEKGEAVVIPDALQAQINEILEDLKRDGQFRALSPSHSYHWGQGGLETGDYMLGTFRAHVHLSHNVTSG